MTTGEFADLVEKMRDAQKKYFRTRDKETLSVSKSLESQVDKILAERRERQEKEMNPELFGNDEGD